MDQDQFQEILQLVTPIIQREDTVMRESISPAERLAVTLSGHWGIFHIPLIYIQNKPASNIKNSHRHMSGIVYSAEDRLHEGAKQ